MTAVHGLHHVTAIAADPQENLDFYVRVLGMRLVKRTVNQDAPDTYHLFYADSVGTPGTDLTFFSWPHMAPVQPGTGLASEVSLAVGVDSFAYWLERFERLGVNHAGPERRFGEPCLPFRDPHGLRLALVANDGPREHEPWPESAVPSEHQIRGLHSLRLLERRSQPTHDLLTQVLGFRPSHTEDGWQRYCVAPGGSGRLVDVGQAPGQPKGRWGTGGVHHVAWRTRDSEEQLHLRSLVEAVGLRPTAQIDRFWFKSVYFFEPGGVLFELATDGPGFDRDERRDHLGERLVLPPWLEASRDAIESALPRLSMPPT